MLNFPISHFLKSLAHSALYAHAHPRADETPTKCLPGKTVEESSFQKLNQVSAAESERVLLLVGLSAASSFHISVSPQVSKIELLGSIKKEGAITLSALVHIFGQQRFHED